MNTTIHDITQDVLGKFVAEHMDTSARRRWEAGVLPLAEVLDRARDVLFAGLDVFPRYKRLTDLDMATSKGRRSSADRRCPRPAPFYETLGVAGELTARQFETLERIKAGAPAAATVETVMHVGWCCPEKHLKRQRAAAKVTLWWHGRPLSREYALFRDAQS